MPARHLHPARGVSLIIAMVVLLIIGLASVAIMRSATSSDQVALNNRLQTQASQYAQAALRFCENQLTLPAGTHSPVTLQAANTPGWWTQPASWLGSGALKSYRLTAADLNGATPPAIFPQCLVEGDPANGQLYIVTARGFSNDYAADSTTGATRNGSVVWVQSHLLLQ